MNSLSIPGAAAILAASSTGHPWLWVISVLSLAVGGFALAWQVFTWYQDRRPRILIRQIGSSITDRARRIPEVGTIYTVDVAIINQSPRTPAVICGLSLEPPWEHMGINLLEDRGPGKPYIIVRGIEELQRNSVINHRRYEEGRLDVGGVVKGTLVGREPAPIPSQFPQGEFAKFKVWVQDQTRKWHAGQVDLVIDHGPERRR